jgi:hypothetical protein
MAKNRNFPPTLNGNLQFRVSKNLSNGLGADTMLQPDSHDFTDVIRSFLKRPI